MSFLDFCFSSNWERERERESGIQNLSIKEKFPQSYLSYFSTGFHWRIFLLSRANRFCSIFFTLAWRTWGPSCLSILLSSTQNTGFDSSARYESCSKTDFLPIYFRWGEGVPTSVLGSRPIIWLLSSSSWCPATWVRSPSTNICLSPLWPTFFLNGHFFDGLILSIQIRGVVIYLPPPSGISRDNTNQCL